MALDSREQIDQRASYHTVFFRTTASATSGEVYEGAARLWASVGVLGRMG
jgi:hypothetical protein